MFLVCLGSDTEFSGGRTTERTFPLFKDHILEPILGEEGLTPSALNDGDVGDDVLENTGVRKKKPRDYLGNNAKVNDLINYHEWVSQRSCPHPPLCRSSNTCCGPPRLGSSIQIKTPWQEEYLPMWHVHMLVSPLHAHVVSPLTRTSLRSTSNANRVSQLIII
jgi:hypothetical protein